MAERGQEAVSESRADAGRPGEGGRGWNRVARKAAGPVIGIVVVVAIFAAVIPRFADYQQVWEYMTNLSTTDWLVITVCIVANVATSGPPWMAAVPTLSYKRSMLLTQTSTLMTSVLPLGEAVGIGTQLTMLRQWRFTPRAVTAGLVLVAVWNQGVNTLIPICTVIALGVGHASRLLVTISALAVVLMVVLVAVAVMIFRSAEQAHRIGEFAGRVVSRLWKMIGRSPRTGWGDRLVSMRSETMDVVSRRWLFLSVSTLANQLTLFGVMLACLHATGVTGITTIEALAAWSFARLIGSIAITPGSLGIQELGLTGALVAFGGSGARVVATALLYRALTFVPIIIVGSVCLVIWRREQRGAPSLEAT